MSDNVEAGVVSSMPDLHRVRLADLREARPVLAALVGRLLDEGGEQVSPFGSYVDAPR